MATVIISEGSYRVESSEDGFRLKDDEDEVIAEALVDEEPKSSYDERRDEAQRGIMKEFRAYVRRENEKA